MEISKMIAHCRSEVEDFLAAHSHTRIYWTHKIDGVRCCIVVEKKVYPAGNIFKQHAVVKYYSRNDKRIFNLDHFNEDIVEICHYINRVGKIKYPIFLEAEIASPGRKLNELMTNLFRKTVVSSDFFKLYFFDLIIAKSYEERQAILANALRGIKNSNIYYLTPKLVEPDIDTVEKLKDEAIKAGYEGIVLNVGTATYKAGRSNNCCKVKMFRTVDLKVVDVLPGDKGTKLEGKAAALLCQFGEKKIPVSGRMSDAQREEFMKNPPIGKYVEVKYSEITPDGYLRHPVFLRVREDL